MPYMWTLSGDVQQAGMTVSRPYRDVVVVTAAGPVDSLTAPRLGELLRHRLSSCLRSVVVDLTDVSFFNSAGLEVLCECALRAAEHDMALRVVCAPEGRVERVMDLAGVRDRFVLRSQVDSTLADLSLPAVDTHEAHTPLRRTKTGTDPDWRSWNECTGGAVGRARW